MAEPLPEPRPPATLVEPPDIAELALARKNMQWGWALLGLFLLLFAGTVGVAFVYLWLS
ncbi:MAG: hypothetical protein ACJ77E_01700 [Gaiellaceae bacterium]|jgi:hypothetical protein